MLRDVKTFLHSRGVATSRTMPYNTTGNSQCERYNQTIWKAIPLCLKGKGVPEEQWETVLQMCCIRSDPYFVHRPT